MTAQTNTLIRQATKALDGKHPIHGFTVQDGTQHAIAHAVVALATEQQATNQHLAAIADSLSRIATALETPNATGTKTARRVWRRGRKN